MKTKNAIFILSTTLFALVSCKSKWKEPVDTTFHFEAKQSISSQSNLQEGNFFVESASLELTNFAFEGYREQGNSPVTFSEANIEDLTLENGASKRVSIKKQLVQGTYTSINVGVGTALISVSGYTRFRGEIVPFSFEYSQELSHKTKAKDANNSAQIVFEKNHPKEATISIDISSWFSEITPQVLDVATFKDYGGNPPQGQPNVQLIIDNATNPNIYLNLVNKIESSISVTF